MPLPLIRTGISVKAGSCFVPFAVAFASFSISAAKKKAAFFLPSAFWCFSNAFWAFRLFLRTSPLTLVTSLLFRSRSASPSTSLPPGGE
ncbi:hypothetical protein TNCV_2914981 [Trichonephila clavipes]|nr:hypothetical protein TNCV_2914981 [Trichonephila clavipes]